MQIVLSSRNPSKIKQIAKIFEGSPVEILSLDDVGIEGEAVEDGRTLEENALKKASFANKQTGYWSMADDTGIFFPAFNNEPGVDSAYWAGTKEATHSEFVLEKFKGITDRRARFETVVVILDPVGSMYVFKGEVEGVMREAIAVPPQPQMPYSPLFQPLGYDKVWAEMTVEEENAISHRGQAFRQARAFFERIMK